MTAAIRLATTSAAPSLYWREEAACSGTATADFFDDRIGPRRRARGHCHSCPVVASCLAATLKFEGLAGYKWGVSGGLTADQRRAMRCEILLGDTPDLNVAQELISLRWRHVLYPLRMRGDSPAQMAAALYEAFEWKVSPATVRLAVWWLGGKAPVKPRRGPRDERLDWQLIRDECRVVVERLRELGAPMDDIAAHLTVSRHALELAVQAWKTADVNALEVAA